MYVLGYTQPNFTKTFSLSLQRHTLCLKKGTPTLSIVTLKRINGF